MNLRLLEAQARGVPLGGFLPISLSRLVVYSADDIVVTFGGMVLKGFADVSYERPKPKVTFNGQLPNLDYSFITTMEMPWPLVPMEIESEDK